MATAVISSNEAMHYLHSMWEGLPVIAATIALLALFMALSIIGIIESAVVAIGIFLFHLTSMFLLMVFGVFALSTIGLDMLSQNLSTPTEGGIAKALFFGFATSDTTTPTLLRKPANAIEYTAFKRLFDDAANRIAVAVDDLSSPATLP